MLHPGKSRVFFVNVFRDESTVKLSITSAFNCSGPEQRINAQVGLKSITVALLHSNRHLSQPNNATASIVTLPAPCMSHADVLCNAYRYMKVMLLAGRFIFSYHI